MPQSYGSKQIQSNSPKPNRLSTFFRKNHKKHPQKQGNGDSPKSTVKLKKKYQAKWQLH